MDALAYNPPVTVIINCRNGERFLKTAINSALAQTYEPVEVLVVDNASTDQTPEIARSYGSRVAYLHIDHGVSLAAARNIGIRRAKGDLIAFLDVDDQFMPEKVAKQVVCFERPDIGLVYTNCIYRSRGGADFLVYAKGVELPSGDIVERLLSDFSVVLSSVMFRKAVLVDAGLMDERLNHSEDFHLLMQICTRSKAIGLIEPLSIYLLHGGNLSLSNYKDQYRDSLLLFEYFKSLGEEFLQKYHPQIERWVNKHVDGLWVMDPWFHGDAVSARERIREKGYLYNDRGITINYYASYFMSWETYRGILFSLRTLKRKLYSLLQAASHV